MISKIFLSKLGNENTAQSYFKKDIWLQIKALFSPCCGLGRKLVGLKDSNGDKIAIDGFPFTFDGTTYATKELFEQAMADAYGAGYSASLVDCCRLMFIWNRGLTEVPDYIVEAAPTYNFDIEMDWSILLDGSLNLRPVTDQATFVQWLTDGNNSSGSYNPNDFTNIVITDFIMTGNRIQCNLTADATNFNLSTNTIVNADKIGIISGLQNLYLSNNQIVTFNPTIALPSGLVVLDLDSNQIVTFNPTIALPSGLQRLYLSNNQIVTFNPTIALPSGFKNLYLRNNQMTTAGYSASEVWANAQPSFTTTCGVYFQGNTNSVSGTNLETILLTKNCIVIV